MFGAIQFNLLQTVMIIAVPLLFAITVHEVAHGWLAYRLGDSTAKMLGRLTLNPIKHIDPLGTIFVPALSIWLGGIIFGWAKPVPIVSRHFKKLRRDAALVAIAGPMTNLLMAIGWGAVSKFSYLLAQHKVVVGIGFTAMGEAGVQINSMLFLLNLLPIPSLDGGHVLSAILPPRWAYYYDKAAPYGLMILLLLWATHLLTALLLMPLQFLITGINHLFFL